MFKRITTICLSAALMISALTGCTTQATQSSSQSDTTSKIAQSSVPVKIQNLATTSQKMPKYVFMFIGDGMSHVQVNAAQVLTGNNKVGEIALNKLNFTQFPVAGVATTFDATSFCPDSASTASAYSTGVKTHSGVIGMAVDKVTPVKSITEMVKESGKKVGIVSSVSIDHATPAAFYSHVSSRNSYYDIAVQMAKSNFDYFGGGGIKQPTGSDKTQKNIYDILKEEGYTVADSKEEINALNKNSGKVYALSPKLQDSDALPYAMDTQEGDLVLADFVKKGIDVMDNDNGFFLMCESGKIDWACHANDAMAAMQDVLAFEDAIQEAIDFAKKKPDETLIIVTGDHETGGMTIGYAATGYNTAFDILDKQKMSYVAFDELITEMKSKNPNMTFAQIMPIITENFGLIAPDTSDAAKEENKMMVLSEMEYQKLKNGFNETMKATDKRNSGEEASLLYGGYEPLSVSLTHIINNKAGIGWTSYSHTGTPVPVYAYGAGSEVFNGSYDNVDVFNKLVKLMNLK